MLKKIIGKKKILMLVLGIIVGILISVVSVYAVTLIDSKSVTYDNSGSNLTSTNVQDALDELHKRLVPKQEGLLSNYLISLFHDGNIETIHIGGDSTKPTVMLNYSENLMLDNNGEYRYYGSKPNNYIKFNNEVWRIINISNVYSKENGNSEMRVKIIRDIKGTHSMYSDTNHGGWTENLVMYQYLNNTFYNTLLPDAKNKIDNALWYLGVFPNNEFYSNEAYNYERGNQVVDTTKSSLWTGIINLMYPSDYLYATDLSKCVKICSESNWLYNIDIINDTINTSSIEWVANGTSGPVNNPFMPFSIRENGGIGSGSGMGHDVNIRPVAYLKANIKIISGTGREDDPYIIE